MHWITYAPLAGVKGFLVDLDGVVWVGGQIAPGAIDFWEYCQSRNIPVAFVSNASAQSREGIRQKLERLGIQGANIEQIFPSTRAAALYVTSRKVDARVFVVGEFGLIEELEAVGAVQVDRDADFVVVGVDRYLSYERLERACREVIAGAELVATSADANFPTENGVSPAAGVFKAMVETCSQCQATTIGKPEVTLLQMALDYLKLQPSEAAMIGDTPYSDLVGARRVGTRAVLLGDHSRNPLAQQYQPEVSCRDLAELMQYFSA